MQVATATEYGVHFETGVPVKFIFARNTDKSPPAALGDRYQQRIEPAGRYLIHVKNTRHIPREWEHGNIRFKRPLVIPFNLVPGNLYDDSSWKRQLELHYKKRGRALSRAIVVDGYDGIVTVRDGGTSEIVDLTWMIA